MIVMKFGGTSLGSAERIAGVADRVRERLKQQPVVVVSALSRVTDLLVRAARISLDGGAAWEVATVELLSRHRTVVSELVPLISQPRMLMAYGFVAKAFEVFARHRTPVDLIATSEVSISLTVDDPASLPVVDKDLAELGDVKVLRGMAIVSVVGRGFIRQHGLAGRIFQALREVNIVMISFGASDVNISFVVKDDEAEKAVRLLHREFFEAA